MSIFNELKSSLEEAVQIKQGKKVAEIVNVVVDSTVKTYATFLA